ncbi:hypothetical protein KHX94_01450 [Shewanella dokdonensis]|uniref:Lipoprotein n=1 Tax=Shewanella dokdonensis TaxID=712036 RepID=A0ABX8DFG3_9GAMM|nr:hypothetical protein [Shewanella dokdonensis]QVK23478.1 hypothetical protein KHX94_01450 [Shewanella dokdonensis]
MKRWLLLLAALLTLSACSTKMSYHFLDWAIAWQLDDYVSLNKAQQQQFDQALQAFCSGIGNRSCRVTVPICNSYAVPCNSIL